MHRHSIMAHILVAEFKVKLTCHTIGTWIEYPRDMLWDIAISLSIPLATYEPTTFLHPNWISILELDLEGICVGKSWRVQQASISWMVTNLAWCPVGEMLCIRVTVVSWNRSWYKEHQVKESLVAFVQFRARFVEFPSALQMLSVQVWV